MKDSDDYKYGYESDARAKLRNQLKFHNGHQKYLKTELKRAIKIAKKACISKRQITAEVNHRYRTVLTSVICYSEILPQFCTKYPFKAKLGFNLTSSDS